MNKEKLLADYGAIVLQLESLQNRALELKKQIIAVLSQEQQAPANVPAQKDPASAT